MSKGINFFKNIKKPEMNELVNWFQINFTSLSNDMKLSNHSFSDNKPNSYHLEDTVWTHTMMACLNAENNNATKINKIAILLHDIGKPLSREIDETKKRVNFIGHEGISSYLAIKPLKELLSYGVITKEEMEDILFIISQHGTLFNNIDKEGNMLKKENVFSKFISANKINTLVQILDKDNNTTNIELIKEYFKKEITLFNNFIMQVYYDSTGRFHISTNDNGRKNFAYDLGKKIYTEEQLIEYIFNSVEHCLLIKNNKNQISKKRKQYENKNIKSCLTINKNTEPYIKVLVGPPGIGKSTYINECIKKAEDFVLISRDNTLMKYALDNNIIGKKIKCSNCNEQGYVIDKQLNGVRNKDTVLGKCNVKGCQQGYITILNYSQVWQELSEEDQKNIDKILEKNFQQAFKKKKNIIIDMTNMSNKKQKKWINKCNNKYYTEGIVFFTDLETLLNRINKRNKEIGKDINYSVILKMLKSFTIPNYDIFDEIKININ